MNYNNFQSDSNYIAPVPSWTLSATSTSVSTTTPLSEDVTGALDFSKWKEFGGDFLVKSNINNWLTCSPAGGGLAEYKHGKVNCKITKIIVPGVCEDVVPHILLLTPSWHGPALFAADFYYYFEGSASINWPVADPCGSRQSNHLPNVPDPSGLIYLRESPPAKNVTITHIHKHSSPSG